MPKKFVGSYPRAQGISYDLSLYQQNYYQNNKYRIKMYYESRKEKKLKNLFINYGSEREYYKNKLIEDGYLEII